MLRSALYLFLSFASLWPRPGLAEGLLPAVQSFTDAGWQETMQQIRSLDPASAQSGLRRLIAANGADVGRIARTLHRHTATSATAYKTLLRSIGASVPDRGGRFGEAQVADLDWFDALLQPAPPANVGTDAMAADVRRQTVVNVALIRALGRRRDSPEAAESLLRFAYRHRGAFRDECGRVLRAMGDAAVVALVRSGAWRDPLDFRIKRYAAYQLDRMDRAQPARALAAAPESLKVELLRAYGEVREETAVNAVVSFTRHESPRVRRAARWATLRYFLGEAPQTRKRHLRVAGGSESAGERTLYLTYRQMALRRVGQALTSFGYNDDAIAALAKEPEKLVRTFFAKLDGKPSGQQPQSVKEAKEALRRGQTAKATKIADGFLLESPDHESVVQFAEVYLQRASELETGGKFAQSLALYSKAAALLGDSDRRRPVALAKSLLQEARLAKQAGDDMRAYDLLGDAVSLDASLAGAKDADLALASEGTTIWWVALFAGILLVAVIGLNKRRRRWP